MRAFAIMLFVAGVPTGQAWRATRKPRLMLLGLAMLFHRREYTLITGQGGGAAPILAHTRASNRVYYGIL